MVAIYNGHGGRERVARTCVLVAYDIISKKCIATYFPEAKVLIPIDTVAEYSNTPVFKSVRVKLRRAAQIDR